MRETRGAFAAVDTARRIARRLEALPSRWRDPAFVAPWTIDVPEPSFDEPVSQACTSSQMTSDAYARWCSAMGEEPRGHRKQWEHCFILQALAVHDLVGPGNSGVGFGVGREPLVSVLAGRGCSVLATDAPPDLDAAQMWEAAGQHASSFDHLNERGLCPDAEFLERVETRHVDMRQLPDDLGVFDFTWSSCVIEHLGSRSAGLEFFERHLEHLRPGGVAVHTTELNVSSRRRTQRWGDTIIYLRSDLERFGKRMRSMGHHIEFNWNLGHEPIDTHVDAPPFSEDRHLKLQLGAYQSTSFGLVVRTGL